MAGAARPVPARRPSPLENAYVIGALFLFSSPFLGLFSPIEEFGGASNVYVLALQIVLYLTAGILVFRNRLSFAVGLTDCKWAIALVGLALASAFWAADPLFALRRAVVAAATTAFGIYFGTRYRRDEQLVVLFYVFGGVAIMSIGMVALFPQFGIDPGFDVPDWRGVFETKNMLGKITVLGATAALCLTHTGAVRTGLRFVALIVFGALIVLSGSATAAITGSVLLLLTVLYRCLRWRVPAILSVAMFSIFGFIVLAAIGINRRIAIFALLGRDDTFTGRTPLWDAVVVAIGKRPILGYGFSSFWRGDAAPSSTVVDAVGWIPPHGHNGILDLCLELGVVGLIIFGVGFVLRFRNAIQDYRRAPHRAALWPLVFLTFLLLYNLTESTLLRANSLYWVLYTAALVRTEPRSSLREAHTDI